eukprot:COSAG06_NODE_6112_length_3105_cov_2.346973_2_plen_292_part_01
MAAAALTRPDSEWPQRRGREDGANDDDDDDEVEFATRALSALHVLVRDCANPATVAQGLRAAGPEALAIAGGVRLDCGALESAGWRPIHLAARNESAGAAEIVRLMLEQGDAEEQLAATDGNGWRPIHWAAQNKSAGGVEMVWMMLPERIASRLRQELAEREQQATLNGIAQGLSYLQSRRVDLSALSRVATEDIWSVCRQCPELEALFLPIGTELPDELRAELRGETCPSLRCLALGCEIGPDGYDSIVAQYATSDGELAALLQISDGVPPMDPEPEPEPELEPEPEAGSQ